MIMDMLMLMVVVMAMELFMLMGVLMLIGQHNDAEDVTSTILVASSCSRVCF